MTLIKHYLEDLDDGERFETCDTHRRGALLFCSPSSATVRWDGRRHVEGTNRRNGTTFSFDRRETKETISLHTEVYRLVRRPVKKR